MFVILITLVRLYNVKNLFIKLIKEISGELMRWQPSLPDTISSVLRVSVLCSTRTCYSILSQLLLRVRDLFLKFHVK